MTDVKQMPAVDRVAANRRAIEVRRARAAVKLDLESGLGHSDALRLSASADAPEGLRTLRVTEFVQTLPNIGAVKGEAILEKAGVSERKRLGGLGVTQRERLRKEVVAIIERHRASALRREAEDEALS